MSVEGSETPFIRLRNGGIVPFLDLAEEDVREHRAGELEVGGDARQVVDRDIGAKHGRKMQNRPRRRLQLFVGHGTIGRPEKHGLVADLADAAAGSDRLVVDLHLRVLLVVLVEPLRVDRVREGRAGAVDLLRPTGGRLRVVLGRLAAAAGDRSETEGDGCGDRQGPCQ
jgi:hypothetical protein